MEEKKRKKRKKWPIVVSVIVVLLIAGYCYLFLGDRITDASSEIIPGDPGTRSLIVYFTRSGVITAEGDVDAVSSASMNVHDGVTEQAAMQLQQITGADMFEIRTDRYYRNSYGGTAMAALIEETLKTRPALAAIPDTLDQYDTIYVGYPIWWFNAPMAIGSFLESYDLSGKTVVPFCTAQDNGIDVSMDYIRKVSGNAMVLDGYRFNHSTDDEVRAWLTRIGIEN